MYSKFTFKSHILCSILALTNNYRLDDGLRQLRDLDCCGNQCIDAEHAVRGVYFGFQGDLNPIVADGLSSKVFIIILQQWAMKNTILYAAGQHNMAERRIEDFRLAPPGWGMDSDSDEDLDFPLRGELPSELNWIEVLYNLCFQVTIPA